MNSLKALGIALALIFALPALALEAGAAKTRLIVPEGTPPGGQASRMGRPSLGEHDALWVRCLHLDDGVRVAYLVSLDLPQVPATLRDRIVELVADFAPADAVFLTATGTQSGPGGMEQALAMRWVSGRYSPATLEITAQAAVAAMEEARAQKRRATVGHTIVKESSLVANRFGVEMPLDEHLGILRVDDADGKAISVVINLGARAETAPATDTLLLSADFPGAVYRAFENLLVPECVAMFLPGATADQLPGAPEGAEGWERVEAIGTRIAERAMKEMDALVYRDATLAVRLHEAPLPASLATALLPESALFQMLALDGLEFVFIPGDLTGALAASARNWGAAPGKKARFVVGRANGNIGALLGPAHFTQPAYLATESPFGPDAARWLNQQVAALTGAESDATVSEADPDQVARARGESRGTALRDRLTAQFAEQIQVSVQARILKPEDATGKFWPPMLDPSPLALPRLGRESRALLESLETSLIAELDGLAAGAGLPFDAVLVLHRVPEFAARGDDTPAPAPAGTLVAALGKRAAGESPVAAANLDEPGLAVVAIEPGSHHGLVFVGREGEIGALAGMNGAGVLLCLARNATLGDAPHADVGAALALRAALQTSDTYDSAVARLRAAPLMRGHQVLAAGPTKNGWRAALISYGKAMGLKETDEGLILGLDPESGSGDNRAQERYAEAARAIGEEAPVARAMLEGLMTATAEGVDRPWNPQTGASLIFEPAKGVVAIALPDAEGRPGSYTEYRIKKAVRDE